MVSNEATEYDDVDDDGDGDADEDVNEMKWKD